MAEKTTVSKNKTAAVGKYSYKYTDLAQIHEEMERQGLRYYQYVDPSETPDGFVDYIITVVMNENGETIRSCRGCRVVDANGQNPTQEHGKAITYARRYSLLMALGWATDDDDAAGNIRTRPERKTQNRAENEAVFVQCVTPEQIDDVRKALAFMGCTEKDVLLKYGISEINSLSIENYNAFMESFKKWREKNG